MEEEAEARPEQSVDEGEESDDVSTSGSSGTPGEAKKRRKKVGRSSTLPPCAQPSLYIANACSL